MKGKCGRVEETREICCNKRQSAKWPDGVWPKRDVLTAFGGFPYIINRPSFTRHPPSPFLLPLNLSYVTPDILSLLLRDCPYHLSVMYAAPIT